MSYTPWIILTARLVGIICGLVGVFLILRKTAMMADAISHTVLLGIVLTFLITGEVSGPAMLIGGICAGVLTAFLVQVLDQLDVQRDAAIGIVFTTLLAIWCYPHFYICRQCSFRCSTRVYGGDYFHSLEYDDGTVFRQGAQSDRVVIRSSFCRPRCPAGLL